MTDVFAALTGTGDLLLPAARFVPLIGVSVTTFPQGAAVMDATSPRRVMKVGWIAPGRLGSDPSWPASLFFEDAKWIDFERQLMTYPAPGVYADRVRYHLEPGAVATVYVNATGVPAVPNANLAPWDRNRAVAGTWNIVALTPGAAAATLWTYTVPTGKLLYLAAWTIGVHRRTVATAAGVFGVSALRGGNTVLLLESTANTIDAVLRDGIGAPLYLGPGETISAIANDASTGGGVTAWSTFSGFLFDV